MSAKFILIDGVCYEQALKRLYMRDEDLQIEPLYTNTPWYEVADLGPILISPGESSALWEEIEQYPTRHAAAVLTSPAPLADVANHLRQFNRLTDAQGNQCLLRYADPLVAWFWLGSFEGEGLSRILGPISDWRTVRPQAAWEQQQSPQWQHFECTNDTGSGLCHPLGPAQEQALRQAYRWQLKSRIHGWLHDHHSADLQRRGADDISAWMDEQLQEAEAFGLTSERSMVIWCALSLRQGDDFATASDGVYRRWLSSHEDRLPPTPDQRLQQYYQESV